MRDHPVPVGVVRRLVPAHAAHRETFSSSTVLVDLSTVAARCAQLSRQCLQFICSSPHLGVAAVRCIQRLSASVAVILAAEAMTSSNAMKVRKPEPAEIEYKNMKFLITYRPTDATMDRFIEVCLSVELRTVHLVHLHLQMIFADVCCGLLLKRHLTSLFHHTVVWGILSLLRLSFRSTPPS